MGKIKYACQHDNFSCGPTALWNICKWAELDITKKDLIESCGGLKKLRKLGTDTPVFHYVLCSIPGVYVSQINYRASLKELDNHLDSGGIVAISYLIKNEWGHYSLIVKRTKKCYIAINAVEGIVKSNIKRKEMRQMLDVSDFLLGTYNCSVAWMIKKSK